MFREVSSKVSYPKMEEGVIEFWRRTDAFRKVQELRRDGPAYTFYEGPPTANGLPHIGHVLPRSLKDLFPRYKTMLGYYVPRKAGWDTHGLPVELEVEKKLGITSKPEIERYGVAEFIAECKESVWKYEKEWERLTERIGFWLDLDDAYVTYRTEYIESIWWALRRIWDKGWLYQGYRVVPYCPRCGTSLSSHEVAQGYEEIEDPSVFVRFPLAGGLTGPGWTGRNGPEEPSGDAMARTGTGRPFPVSLLVWTTTPWTLPSNTAVAAHPDIDYVAAVPEGDEEVLVVAAALAPAVFAQGYKALATIKGRDLAGRSYEPPFPFFENHRGEKNVFTVLPGDFVTLEDGTGLVHLAPAFGEDDMNAAREHGLPVWRPVDGAGCFTGQVEPWEGRFVKDADPAITEALRSSGKLYRSDLYRHNYPFCWRCHSPLLYYADTGWFIKMTAVKDEIIRLNRDEVNWYPEHVKDGRFGDWLENLVDWNLSRSRYWGTPLPIWECRGGGRAGDTPANASRDSAGDTTGGGCGHRVCVGSIEELKRLARPETIPEPFDPHKPYIDRVILTCPECGGEMRRVPELIDVWFDSGSMPFAQWHYPFEHKEEFERHFPADFICEAVDQTRGWFYSLFAIATVVFGMPCFRNCVVTEFGVDEQGRKMSKHLGNVMAPWEVLDNQGADALRWFIYGVSHPWFEKRFSHKAIAEFRSRMQDTLWNVYSFFVLYANLDRFEPDAAAVLNSAPAVKARLAGREVPVPSHADRSALDRWILARLNQLVTEVRERLDRYDVLPATRAVEAFVDDLSNWYVRRGRRRYWRSGADQDKVAAYQTLYEVLVTLSRLLAPFTPFLAEEVYQNLVRRDAAYSEGPAGQQPGGDPATALPESVHHCLYPEAHTALIDEELAARMAVVRDYVALARAARNRAGIRTRQPLRRAVLVGPAADAAGLGDLLDLLSDEVNVKEVAAAEDLDLFAVRTIKPRFDVLGPRLGPLAPKVAKALQRLGPEQVADAARRLAAGRSIEVRVEEQETPVSLEQGDVEIRTDSREGWSVEGEDGRYVALETDISTDLLMEGLAREMVNRIQRLRKEAGFDVEDHIETVYSAAGDVAQALVSNRGYVASETLSSSFREGPVPEGGEVEEGGWHVQAMDLEGETVTVAVRKVR
ncbi:MAG: isoleucine--tRNA ligase [Bacillota bacterium]|nr:MAG: isoleucine--tRNA ligase [Bacillota bacterium]